MRWLWIGSLFLLHVAAGAAPPNVLPADIKSFQGTWLPTKLQLHDGSTVEKSKLQDLTIVVTENKLIFQWPTSKHEFDIKLGSSDKLKTIDLTPLDATVKGELYLGIYELRDDTLKLCMPMKKPNQVRPKEFKPAVECEMIVIFLERDK